MPLYDTPASTDFISLLHYIQFNVGIPFVQLTILSVFFVSFFALKRWETIKAFASSIFITFLSSLFFWLMGLLEVIYVLGSAVALAVTIILLYFYREA